MLRFKSCPRCKNGDVTLDRDYYGWYECCIQCGHISDLGSVVKAGQQQAWDGKDSKTIVETLGKGN